MASRSATLLFHARRFRRIAEGALWAVVILGGIAFFFYLIWNPPR